MNKILQIIVSIIMLLVMGGCTEKGTKTDTTNLIDYLPMGKVGTTYINQFTGTGIHVQHESRTIIKKKDNCIIYNVLLESDGKIESDSKDSICATKSRLYRSLITESTIINLSKKEWVANEVLSKNGVDNMLCNVDSYGKIGFKKKQYDTLVVKCKSKKAFFFITYAKTLGRVKVDHQIEDFGTVGGMLIADIIFPTPSTI